MLTGPWRVRMTDLVTTARTARERLSVGLNALQNPGTPEVLQAAAEPIAQAMSSLLQIERTGSLPLNRSGPNVLDFGAPGLGKTPGSDRRASFIVPGHGSRGRLIGFGLRACSAREQRSPGCQQCFGCPAKIGGIACGRCGPSSGTHAARGHDSAASCECFSAVGFSNASSIDWRRNSGGKRSATAAFNARRRRQGSAVQCSRHARFSTSGECVRVERRCRGNAKAGHCASSHRDGTNDGG